MKKDKVTLYLDTDDIDLLNKIAEFEDTSPSRIVRGLIRDHLSTKKPLLQKLAHRSPK